MTEPPVAEPRRRRRTTALKVSVSAMLLGLLIYKAGLESLITAVRHVDGRWILVALTASLIGVIVQTTQWHVLLKSVGLHRRWLRCLRVVFIGTTFNTVLPSSIGGDVVRAVMIAEAPEERIAAASAVVLQRLCNFPGMVALLIVSLMRTLGDSAATRVRPVGAAAAVAGTALILVCASPLLGSLARRHLLSLHRVGRAVSKLLSALDAFRGRRRELIGAWLRGSVFWIDVVINQYALMRAIGIHTSIPLAALVIITVTAVTFLPLSINGLGIREGGFATFLTVGGAATVTQGVAVGLLVSAQTLVLALIGLACIWTPGRGLRAAPPTLEGLDGIAG